MLTTPPEGLLEDVSRFLGPDERRGMRVPCGEVALDVADQGADGLEGAAAHRLAGEDAEPGLDHVQPRSALGCEMKVHLGMPGQPGLDRGCGEAGTRPGRFPLPPRGRRTGWSAHCAGSRGSGGPAVRAATAAAAACD